MLVSLGQDQSLKLCGKKKKQIIKLLEVVLIILYFLSIFRKNKDIFTCSSNPSIAVTISRHQEGFGLLVRQDSSAWSEPLQEKPDKGTNFTWLLNKSFTFFNHHRI